jgi:hypothetical protein
VQCTERIFSYITVVVLKPYIRTVIVSSFSSPISPVIFPCGEHDILGDRSHILLLAEDGSATAT